MGAYCLFIFFSVVMVQKKRMNYFVRYPLDTLCIITYLFSKIECFYYCLGKSTKKIPHLIIPHSVFEP
jgi:hypothetical protein